MTLSIDSVSYLDVAKTIDHSLLKPELDDAFVRAGCELAAAYDVASVCVRPVDVDRAGAILTGTEVKVGTTIGFPHGNQRTDIKVAEARAALADGATELDMVLLIGALTKEQPTIQTVGPAIAGPGMAGRPAPGWYPDPTAGGRRRWWDGSAWGAHEP